MQVLKTLPAKSVASAITSPPYWWIRDYGNGEWKGGRRDCAHRPIRSNGRISVYGDSCPDCGATRLSYPLGMEPTIDQFVGNLCDIFDEVGRVLRDDGALWVNIGDTFSSREKGSDGLKFPEGCLLNIPARFANEMLERGWVLRNDIIWQKPSVRPDGVKNRFVMDYEHFYFFTKADSTHTHYFDQVEVPGKTVDWAKERSIWVENSGVNACGHDSAYSEGLIERPLLACSRPDGIVLDPFLGTGTTGLVAAHYGRDFIGIELDQDYFNRTVARFANRGFSVQLRVPTQHAPLNTVPKRQRPGRRPVAAAALKSFPRPVATTTSHQTTPQLVEGRC